MTPDKAQLAARVAALEAEIAQRKAGFLRQAQQRTVAQVAAWHAAGHLQQEDACNTFGQLTLAMVELYYRAGLEEGKWDSRYLTLIRDRGGWGALRFLLRRQNSPLVARLRRAGRCDLLAENLALDARFTHLFTPVEHELARTLVQAQDN